jgi:hypothetical protein
MLVIYNDLKKKTPVPIQLVIKTKQAKAGPGLGPTGQKQTAFVPDQTGHLTLNPV